MEPMSNADYLTRLQHADEFDALKAAKKIGAQLCRTRREDWRK